MGNRVRACPERWAWVIGAMAAMLTGCAVPDRPAVESAALPAAAPELTDFYDALGREYRALSDYHAGERDWDSADLFRLKAEQVEAGLAVDPEPVPAQILPEGVAGALEPARQTMTAALRAGGRLFSPELAAITQADFDCWLRGERVPPHLSEHVVCRVLFERSLAQLQESLRGSMFAVLANPDGTPSAISVSSDGGRVDLDQPSQATLLGDAAAPPHPAVRMDATTMSEVFGAAISAAAPPPVRFVLYYETGSIVAAPGSADRIAEIVETIRQRPGARVSVVGNTDQPGSARANTLLALRRAEAVRWQLIRQGVAPAQIEAISYGARVPEVETPAGVSEQRNRRVVVTVQ